MFRSLQTFVPSPRQPVTVPSPPPARELRARRGLGRPTRRIRTHEQGLRDARPAASSWSPSAFFVNYDPTGKGHDRASAVEETEVTKLPGDRPEPRHAIELSDAENRVRVARSGDKWVLPEKFNAPAMDATRSTTSSRACRDSRRRERVTKTAASARDKTLGLEPETAKRLKLFDENNKLIADLWVGKIDMSGDRNLAQAGNFVRMEGRTRCTRTGSACRTS